MTSESPILRGTSPVTKEEAWQGQQGTMYLGKSLTHGKSWHFHKGANTTVSNIPYVGILATQGESIRASNDGSILLELEHENERTPRL